MNTEIILALIGLLSTVITGLLIPYIKSKTTQSQRENTVFLIELAVKAAEKLWPDTGAGLKKKDYVIQYINAKGIKLSEEDLNMFIEAAVKELDLLKKQIVVE